MYRFPAAATFTTPSPIILTSCRLEEKLIRIRQLKAAYIIPLVLPTTGINPYKLYKSMKVLNLRPSLYNLMTKSVMLIICHVVTNFLTEQCIRNARS